MSNLYTDSTVPYINIFTTAFIYYWFKSNKEIAKFFGWHLRRHLENHFIFAINDNLGILLLSSMLGQND